MSPDSPIAFEDRSFPPADVADILSISMAKTFELLRDNEIESYRIGRARRVTGRAIRAFEAANKVVA